MARKQTVIALLRGINIGSKNRVPMPRLRELLGELGYEDVRTLVQSGNIVLTSAKAPATLAKQLQKEIAAEFGVDTPVVVRTRDEIAAVVQHNPLGDVATEPKLYQVTFFDTKLAADVVEKLESLRADPEALEVDDREVYAWHPDGVARSKLWNGLAGPRLGAVGTSRNWNTVSKLLELADG
jgi:uncharacterized protein (DUF1697 family)